ncbi:hypothetical protein BJ508DRAFT_314349 [Ascobolus immersus RN42]|uniref:Uncharacterized protein n=1 Tax=Ascobolus immersus RN42 TaxID=1160509 RepID=A0A3N4HFF1_ASCIM|nr:hypothetical protein BJ508DRAFT_314349 [Ascobolus immersus RN42]
MSSFRFLDLPLELHYEIAAQMLPTPAEEHHRIQIPQCFLFSSSVKEFLAIKQTPEFELFDPEIQEFFNLRMTSEFEQYCGLAETTSLIVVLDSAKNLKADVTEYLRKLYSARLCSVLKATFQNQHSLALHNPPGCNGEVHALQWKLAFREVQDVFDKFRKSDTAAGSEMEYRFWSNFIRTLDQDESVAAFKKSSPVSENKEQACSARYKAFLDDFEKIAYRTWYKLYSDIALGSSWEHQNGVDSSEKVLLNWLKEYSIQGKLVYCSRVTEDVRATLLGPRNLARRWQPVEVRYGLIAAVLLHQINAEGKHKEAGVRETNKAFLALGWEHLDMESKTTQEHVVRSLKKKVVDWIRLAGLISRGKVGNK